MRWLYVLLAGCGFQHGAASGTGIDAADDPDARPIDGSVDARPIDARPIDAPPAQAVTTNHVSVADTFIASDSGLTDTNFNNQTSALVDGDILRNVLIRFDLSAIPTNASVTAATMHIWTDSDPGGPVTIYPLLQSWSETESTWNARANGQLWSAAGAAPPSRGTTAVGTVNPTVTFTEYTIVIDTATVAGWVANPATNFGFVFTTAQADGTRFSTRELAVATTPYLAVTHAP